MSKINNEEIERYQRKRQEREQSRAAQTPDTENPDMEKPSGRREPIPETPERDNETVTPGENMSSTVQELTATETVTPEISNVEEIRTNTESAPAADAPDNTEAAAPKIDSLSPILHYIDLILP